MRAFLAVTVSIAAIFAGVAAARAADLSTTYAPGYYAPGYGYPAPPLVIIDDNPGVTMRAYWLAPWESRRYFPANGHRPRLGRLENLHAPRHILPPAESYYRSWSTSSAFALDMPHARVPLSEPQPPSRRWMPTPPAPQD